ncbi:MAG: response regulator [Pseudomonadales bacterium]|nr:response regulator [Pseudomonadales bacterium]
MSNRQKSVLLIDDDSLVANSLARMLRSKQFDVSICPDPKSALAFCDRMKFDLIITDQRMPVMTGTEFAAEVKDKQPQARCIRISGYSDGASVRDAFNKEHIHRHVSKPWDNSYLLKVVDEQIQLGEEGKTTEREPLRLVANF